MLYHLLELFNPKHLPYAYTSVLFRATCAIIGAFFIVVLMGPHTIRFLLKKKLGDRPEFDNAPLNELMKDKANVPTMGGVLIIGTIIVVTLLLARLDNFYVRASMVCIVWLNAEAKI